MKKHLGDGQGAFFMPFQLGGKSYEVVQQNQPKQPQPEEQDPEEEPDSDNRLSEGKLRKPERRKQ